MGNSVWDELVELGADGVMFHPISTKPWEEECEIICAYTKDTLKHAQGFPKTNRSYYNIVDEKLVWIKW